MASSAFSFHCMICFEEFDPNTNYPVVLPCGHTYVCVTCANKIDICMECRTPLVMKIEVPPPPPPPNTPQLEAASGGQQRRGSGAASPSLTTTTSSGNEYADRVQNSPGFRRRYGHREEYNQNKRSGTRVNMPAQQKKPEPIKTRLPLPKNAVLLSLIQASEPHRRRAEVEAPPTPVKTQEEKSLLNLTVAGSSGESSPIAARSGGLHTNSNSTGSLPKFSRPSPLFLDGSASGEGGNQHANNEMLQGSSADGEEHKILVGTYLEGGPCGTYAVAVKSGLLVYPTLFEHTLPRGLQQNGQINDSDVDVVKRDVENVVKNYYRESNAGKKKALNDRSNIKGKSPAPTTPKEDEAVEQLGNPTISVECHEDENIEAHCTTDSFLPSPTKSVQEDLTISPTGQSLLDVSEHSPVDISMMSDPGVPTSSSDLAQGVGDKNEDVLNKFTKNYSTYVQDVFDEQIAKGEAMMEERRYNQGTPKPALAATASGESDVGLSLTISDDEDENDTPPNNLSSSIQDLPDMPKHSSSTDNEDVISASVRTLPARRSQSIAVSGLTKDDSDTTNKKYTRSSTSSTVHQQKKSGKIPNAAAADQNSDEFERPLIRLKYGDRVQVVSMDSRGWVKLARGYGYIRLENSKQLVKVGGTSDKACQIEAMLHELSLERNRLKNEQTKLEHLSAGLMIDLQSSLLTSEDRVVVSAPEGSLLRSESELSLAVLNKSAVDDIDVSKRSRAGLRTPRDQDQHVGFGDSSHREIRTAKSHSPGRSGNLTSAKSPPSPPYGQVTPNLQHATNHNLSTVQTPTRVNFRTGLSGHRALTSSLSHPHDFISSSGSRTMSNHAGVSTSTKKSSNTRGRMSIY